MNNDDLVLEELASLEGSQANNNQITLDSVVNWQLPVLAILFMSVVFIAIKTVVHRHDSRAAYVKLQKLEKERDKLAAQWSRLKLEQAVTLNQVRVEQYARWDLNMKMPKASEVKIIHESEETDIAANYRTNTVKVSTLDANPAVSSKMALGN